MMRVSDEDLARLDAVATHGGSVLRDFEDTNNGPLARVLAELIALRKVADAAVAYCATPLQVTDELDALEAALKEAGR